MGETKPFLVIEDEESGRFVVVPAAGRPETDPVVARVDSESAGWLIAAALPAALLRNAPSVLQAGEADDVFWLRDESVSGVELASLGVHVVRDSVEALVSVTRTPESLAGLLRAAPREVLEKALAEVRKSAA